MPNTLLYASSASQISVEQINAYFANAKSASRELCSMLCGSLNGSGVLERMDTSVYMAEWIHVYMWLNGYMCIYGGLDCCVPETFATLLICYTPESKSFLRSRSGIIMIAIFRIELHFYGMAIFIFASKRSVHSLPTIRS